MKHFFLTFLIITALSATSYDAFAQQRPSGEGRYGTPGRNRITTEQMIKELELNEQQSKQFAEIMKQMRPSAGTRDKDSRPSREEMAARRAEMEKRRAEANKKLKTILTKEQYRKYQSMNQRTMPQRPTPSNSEW